MKVLLISIDGLRPDALTNHEKAQSFIKRSAYTMTASTVMPSMTLPCHMSMFHSVDPDRHGTTINIYTPQVRPIDSMCDVLNNAGKYCGMFFNWYQLRDLTSPNALEVLYYGKAGRRVSFPQSNNEVTNVAIEAIEKKRLDFAFLYLGCTDETGHRYGWMSDEYMAAVDNSFNNVEKIVNTLSDEWAVIVTADHGGHDRCHGTDLPEDMTIPFMMFGNGIEPGELGDVNIKDVAPTVLKLMGIEAPMDWEGKALV